MKTRTFIAWYMLIILMVACATANVPTLVRPTSTVKIETATPTIESQQLFQMAELVELPNAVVPAAFKIAFGGNSILVTWKTSPSMPQENNQRRLTLDLKDKFYATLVWFALYQGDLILAYNTSNTDVSASYIARFGSQNLTSQWIAPASAGLGEPIIRGRYVYIPAFGVVGKLNLNTGQYIWKHGVVYDPHTIDFPFQRPVFDGERVIFPGVNSQSHTPQRIEVNDSTGEIIGIYAVSKP